MANTDPVNARIDPESEPDVEDILSQLDITPEQLNAEFQKGYNSILVGHVHSVDKVDAVMNEVLTEYEEMKKNPGNYRRYGSFDELLCEIIADA